MFMYILVTCSKIHERLLHCGIGEKREKERGIRGRDQRERERGEGGGMQILTNSESQLSDTSCLYKVPVVKCTRDNHEVKIERRMHAYQFIITSDSPCIDHIVVPVVVIFHV